MEELYHFSEEPGIERFRPRPASAYPELEPVVFAIDGEHAPHYYFPRDCPRVISWKSGRTNEDDLRTLFAHTRANKIAVVESGAQPDTALWKQVRSINAGIYKIYEELSSSAETLEQRVRLAHLACDFSVLSKMKSYCRPLLRLLASRHEPWSAAELLNVPELAPMRDELQLVLKKLANRSLVREVLVACDPGCEALELRYTS